MDTTELLRQIFNRIKKYRVLILGAGIILAVLLAILAISKRAEYTTKATLFPLTSTTDNALTAGTLSGILGLGETPKSFTSEAAINIIELAVSRNVRESVAGTRLPEMGNVPIAKLLVDEENSKKGLLEKNIEYPADSIDQVTVGGSLLKPAMSAKINKNGVLEIYYSSTNKKMVKPVCEVIIAKISQFYIDLRIKKALTDYNFTLGKIDSFQKRLGLLNDQAIGMQNRTFFTPSGRLEYEIPKEDLLDEKARVTRQRDISVNNREEALWRLQKVTPIIATLDRPAPPFDVKRSSPVVFGVIGFFAGTVLAILFLSFGLLYRYARSEIYKAIFGAK